MAESDPQGEACQRCGEVGEDRRTLWMACFYAMNELGLPFEERTLFDADLEHMEPARAPTVIDLPAPPHHVTIAPGTLRTSGELTPQHFFTLRVCKACRGDWMGAIQRWFADKPAAAEAFGSGIFIRRHGANVEISEEALHPDGREPVRAGESLVNALARHGLPAQPTASDLQPYRERYPGARPGCPLAAEWKRLMEVELGRPLVWDETLGEWR